MRSVSRTTTKICPLPYAPHDLLSAQSVHYPVMLEKSLMGLGCKSIAKSVWIDGTFGAGSFTRSLLQQLPNDASLVTLDRDPRAYALACHLSHQEPRVRPLFGCFSELPLLLKYAYEISGSVQGIIFDLGVSSPQLDEAERGFAYRLDGPLDMRMSHCGYKGFTTRKWLDRCAWLNEEERNRVKSSKCYLYNGGSYNASDLIMGMPEARLTLLFQSLGELRNAKQLANAIASARRTREGINQLTTTRGLADLVKCIAPNDLSRVFQALRMHVNDELKELEGALKAAQQLLLPGGRLVVLAFHTLEHQMIEKFIRTNASLWKFVTVDELLGTTDVVAVENSRHAVVKSVKASEEEVQQHSRSHCARMWCFERSDSS